MLWSSCKPQSLSKSYSKTQKQREVAPIQYCKVKIKKKKKKKNSCFLGLKSLEITSLPPSAAHQNSILSSFKEKQPSLFHVFIINRRRLQSQEFHFSLFLRNSFLQGSLRVTTVQTKRTLFFAHPHGLCHPSIQYTFIHHPYPEGLAVSINLQEQFPIDAAAGIHKEGEVQAMTKSLVYLSWPDACL